MNKIQRKFLMSADIQRWLKKQILRLEKIEQFYSKSDRDTTCYYLKNFPNTYTKVMTDKEGKEELLTVTEEEYTVQRKNHIGKKIAKKSYTSTTVCGVRCRYLILFIFLSSIWQFPFSLVCNSLS